MRLHLRDWVATVLVAATLIPYIGYLVRGTMPFIEDPRGMSGTGLVLGLAAFVVLGIPSEARRGHVLEAVLAGISLAIGVAALAFAETVAAEVLLAAFMVSIVAVLAVTLLAHSGVTLHRAGTPMVHA
ncbi:hypothetical protein [Georgenia satyanarayanai]|uniref:hypothetical protein n=1 Tax=Georgenia satyanarayanai TaxID=860221 RepID=UPI00186B376C|nr:hypothetical protein [Georgenia satyanarayanai]